ncbi:MAG: hypothetical protein ACRD2C_12955 [Acidimicrobiales bacterium]
METARLELANAVADLEHLTSELRQRTQLVERLEVLTDALLDLVAIPAVVVDAQGRIVAVSRGAASTQADLANALGKPVSSVVGQPLVDEIAAFAAGDGATPGQVSTLAETKTHFTALPDGSTLVVFKP